MTCPFCNLEDREILAKTKYAVMFLDGFPVTEGHTLIVPARHEPDYLRLDEIELVDMHRLAKNRRRALGLDCNLGVNVGEAAGQTIFHAHMHLIPRRPGDVANPRGGVRHVIPGKGHY